MALEGQKYLDVRAKALELLKISDDPNASLQDFLTTNNINESLEKFDTSGGGTIAKKKAVENFVIASGGSAEEASSLADDALQEYTQALGEQAAVTGTPTSTAPSAAAQAATAQLAGETGGGTLSPLAEEEKKELVRRARPPDPPAENNFTPEQQKENRLSEQAALMLTIEEILNKIGDGKLKNRIYRNFTTIRYDKTTTPTGHFFITNNFTKNENMETFFKSLPPQILSLLIPTIKIYKTFYVTPKNTSAVTGMPKGYDWRIPFDDVPVRYGSVETSEFTVQNVDEILSGKGTFHSVGIKSFNYEYRGTDPSTVNTNIHATLEIFFQNPADLVKTIGVNFNDGRFVNKPTMKEGNEYSEIKFSYADLVNQTSRYSGDTKDVYNDQYYRIKVECGYADINTNLVKDVLTNSGFGDKIDQFINAVKSSKVILNLAPYSHDITFNDEGTINLKINFNASLDVAMSSREADVLTIAKETETLIKIRKIYDFYISNKNKKINELEEKEEQECKSEEEIKNDIEAFKKEYKTTFAGRQYSEKGLEEILRGQRKNTYNGIFNYLIGKEVLPISLTEEEKKIYEKPKIRYAIFKPEILGIKNGENKDANETRLLSLKDSNQLLGVENLFEDEWVDTLIIEPPKEEPSFLSSIFGDEQTETPDLADDAIKSLDDRMKDKYNSTSIYKIKFILLGDLMDIALECLNNIQPAEDVPKIAVGNIPISLPQNLEESEGSIYVSKMKEIYPNLADIPISLSLLQEFLIENMVRPNLERYPVIQFIKDIVNKLIFPAIGPSVYGKMGAINSAIKFSTSVFTFNTENGVDAITGRPSYKRNFLPVIDEDRVSNLEKMKKNKTIFTGGKLDEGQQSAPESVKQKYSNYMFIVCTSKIPNNLKGYEKEDIKNGVFHFRMGTESGIIKKINFEKMNAPFQREMIARREGDSKGTTVKQYYNTTIDMFGNNIFRPGDYIYVHPNYMFNNNFVALQDKLGVGGYYLVINVKTDINELSYTTKLKCSFQGQVITKKVKVGDTEKQDKKVLSINNC
jgi:hypothetical protein